MSSIFEKFNLGGFRLLNDLAGHNVLLDKFMIFSAKWLAYLLVLYVLWLVYKQISDRKIAARTLLLSVGSAIVARFIFVEIIRHFVYSPRPFLILENVKMLVSHDTESSFPSGHTTFFFALATGTYFMNKKAGVWLLVLAGLIGVARIFVGIHWPLDILSGVAVGIGTPFLVRRIMRVM